MNNSHLIIIITLVVLLVALCIIYLIANRGNEKVVELSFKSLLVPVVIAFGLFLFELLKPIVITENKVIFATTENPFLLTQLTTSHESSMGLINSATLENNVFYGKNKDSLPFSSDKNRIEIAEILILHLLHRRYSQHWQIDYQENEPFFDMDSSITSMKSNADKKFTNLDESALHKIYSQDHLIQEIDSEIKFVIPKNTDFIVSGDNFERKIQISNKYIVGNIVLQRIGVGTLPHMGGKTASMIRKRLNLPLNESYRLDFYGFVLKLDVTPNRLLKWNPKTIEQTEWLFEMFEYLRKAYGWETILEKLEQSNYS